MTTWINKFLQSVAFPAPTPTYDKDFFKPQNLKYIYPETGYRREIPILCFKQREFCKNWMIYFHGNAEDLLDAAQFVTQMMVELQVNIIAVEYPGYGIYKDLRDQRYRDKIIEDDATQVFAYVQQKFNVQEQNIYIMGRSIGTGPAFYLASTKKCAGLIVISPYKSVNQAKCSTIINFFGSCADVIFNNFQRSENIQSKCLIIHGTDDQVIPIQNSQEIERKMKSLNLEVVFKQILYKGHNDLNLESDITQYVKQEFIQLKKTKVN